MSHDWCIISVWSCGILWYQDDWLSFIKTNSKVYICIYEGYTLFMCYFGVRKVENMSHNINYRARLRILQINATRGKAIHRCDKIYNVDKFINKYFFCTFKTFQCIMQWLLPLQKVLHIFHRFFLWILCTTSFPLYAKFLKHLRSNLTHSSLLIILKQPLIAHQVMVCFV